MKKEPLFYIFLLVLIGFAIYIRDLNGPLFLDDDFTIIGNKFIHEFSWPNVGNWFTQNSYAGAGRISEYYRPLWIFSYAVNYWIDGIRPLGYHLVNNLIHIINGVLVFWIALRPLKKHWLAFLAALVFLIHPMQSENVAYIAGRSDLLVSFFILAGLILWIRGVERGRSILYTTLSCISLILALLSRESAVVFPFLALVFYISIVNKEKFWRSLKNGFLKVIPFLVIVAIYFALRLTVLNFRNFLNLGNINSETLYAKHLSVRIFTFLSTLPEYFRTLFYPTNVHERFTFPVQESFFNWPVWLSFLGLVVILVILVMLSKKKRASFNVWFFAWGWFFVALAPGSNIIPTSVIIQDHRLYLALVGIFVLLLYYLEILLNYLKAKELGFIKILIIAGLVLYFSFFSWITVKRVIIWGKPAELFEETIQYEPNALTAYSALGTYYLKAGDYEKAEEKFLAAIKLGAKFPYPYSNMGDLRYVFGTRKDPDKAIFYYKKAIEIDPNFQPPYRRLAELYMEGGDAEAVYYLKKMGKMR